MHLFRKVSAYLCISVILDDGNCCVCLPVEHASMYVANKRVLLYIFVIVCKKLFRLFCYRIRELDTQLPLNWLSFIHWQSFRGGREKNYRWDFRISHPCILFSYLHHKTHTGKPLFSYWAPPLLASCAYKGCGVGEGSPAKQCLGHRTSYLAETLIMQMLHSALGEPLAVWITWKCTQELRCLWTLYLNDPSTLGLSTQGTGFPQTLHSS